MGESRLAQEIEVVRDGGLLHREAPSDFSTGQFLFLYEEPENAKAEGIAQHFRKP